MTIKLRIRPIMVIWQKSLRNLLDFYEQKRGSLTSFFPKLFIAFMLLNMICYWVAIATAYPQELFGNEQTEYFLMQFPVGFLGAMFDSLSFFVTIWIARRALKTTSFPNYVAHLSIDVIIAILATFWVLMVFSVSGWMVSKVLVNSVQSLEQSAGKYETRLNSAVKDPLQKDNLRNIYFGVVMGFSALIPTLTHLYLSAQAVFLYLRKVSKRRFQI